ncbi:MAG: dephospho-CoA kinase [Pseudomonadota bacterium]
MTPRHTYVVGLTGGIASGKSLASDRFATRGVAVVDTDVIAREVVEPGQPAYQDIVAHFGNNVVAIDGTLDRAQLRQRVFADPAERRAIETMTHPRIRERAINATKAADGLYVVLVVPLLVESPMREDMNRVLVIDCPEDVQLARLLARDGSDPKTARAMIAAQASRADRRSIADDVILNDRSPAHLEASVDALDRFYRQLAALRRRRVNL